MHGYSTGKKEPIRASWHFDVKKSKRMNEDLALDDCGAVGVEPIGIEDPRLGQAVETLRSNITID